MNKLALAVICSPTLLAGCGGTLRGDANAGPSPIRGF